MINTVSRNWSGMTYQQNLQMPPNLTVKCNGLLLLSTMILPSLTSTIPRVQFSYHPQSTATLLSIQETLILAINRGIHEQRPWRCSPPEWASNNDLNLLYNPKESKTFYSAIWNTFINPDPSFYSAEANNLTQHLTYKIGENFPRSQYCPTIITHPILVEYTPSTPIPRWNFNKADWEKFTYECRKMCEDLPPPNTDINNTYVAFQRKLIGVAKKCIPRGFHSPYIPGRDKKYEKLANEHAKAKSLDEKRDTANKLLDQISNHCRSKWESTVEKIDMKHSSREAWSTINKLTGKKNNHQIQIASAQMLLPHASSRTENSSNQIRSLLDESIENLRLNGTRHQWTKTCVVISQQMNYTLLSARSSQGSSRPWQSSTWVIHKPWQKVPRMATQTAVWVSSCLHLKKVSKIWKFAKSVAVLKPSKPSDSPSSYRLISFLCTPYKPYERLIYNRLLPIIESVLPKEQAGFRPKRCTLDQVALLTEDIEISFNKKQEVGLVLVNLSAAYDTVWHRGLTLKLLRTIPSK